jgi:lipoyl-dependent peroxiredoxin
LAEAPNSTFWADFATSESIAEKVQVATQSLRLLEKEAKEMRQMTERIIADATNAQREIQQLIGAPK